MSDLVKDFLNGSKLTFDQAHQLFTDIAQGQVDEIQTAAVLATMRERGESVNEIAGAAAAFLDAAVTLDTNVACYDSAGTGGDQAGTINISTGAALLAASVGIPMAKHGNRSVSSKTGSADVLEYQGIRLDYPPEEAARVLEEKNFVFLFAPFYHPAVKRVMPVRSALGVPTLFNTLGPLLNPAPLAGQLMGVANIRHAPIVAQVLATLNRPRALVVNGLGLDEIAVHGESSVWEVQDGAVRHYTVTPQQLGIAKFEVEDLRGGETAQNAEALMAALAGEGSPAHRAAIAVNAGALAYLAGRVETLREGTEFALDTLAAGGVVNYVESLADPKAAPGEDSTTLSTGAEPSDASGGQDE
ncbi:MAG: anthranilate phosphoribosyltransferase [Actinomycetaceae bacterium]|nr:anthranilate phosphoribosyltransferase [Actinomycetaceae bacterium]